MLFNNKQCHFLFIIIHCDGCHSKEFQNREQKNTAEAANCLVYATLSENCYMSEVTNNIQLYSISPRKQTE